MRFALRTLNPSCVAGWLQSTCSQLDQFPVPHGSQRRCDTKMPKSRRVESLATPKKGALQKFGTTNSKQQLQHMPTSDWPQVLQAKWRMPSCASGFCCRWALVPAAVGGDGSMMDWCCRRLGTQCQPIWVFPKCVPFAIAYKSHSSQ